MKTESTLVSILLPVYNGGKLLERAIESVLNQSWSQFELLISDDVSTDDSASIVEQYAKLDKRIVCWRNEKNYALFANYNQCLSRSSGQLVKPFAQDDVFDSSILSEMVSLFDERSKLALISCARKDINSASETVQIVRAFQESCELPGREVVANSLAQLRNWVGEPSTCMFRREFRQEGFDSGFYHLGDLEYWIRILQKGDYYYLDKPLAAIGCQLERTSETNKAGLYFALDWIRFAHKHKDLIAAHGEEESQFLTRAIDATASFLETMIEKDGLNADIVLGACSKEEKRSVNQNVDQDGFASSFKELAFYALRRLSERQGELLKSEHERLLVTSQLSEILNSQSWKLASGMSNVKRAITGGAKPSL